MRRNYWILLAIVVAALLLRLIMLPQVRHPGIADPNAYYSLGKALADGRGVTQDFIWQYNAPPDDITHPFDYWMPLNGVIVAAAFKVGGQSVTVALIPYVLMGALLPLLAFAAARQFGCGAAGSLFGAACAGFLPEFVLNSLRTDTTLPNTWLLGAATLLLIHAIRKNRTWPLLIAGLLAGLAYLIRSDSAMWFPAMIGTALIYLLWRKGTLTRQILIGMVGAGVIGVLVVAPWLMRNQALFGTPTTPHLSRMFFLTHHDEHFAYNDDFTLETMLASQTIPQLLAKRAFEFLASLKLMITTFDIFLPVAVWGGFLLILMRRDKERLLILAPTLLMIVGFLIFYPLLVPMKSQGGSFKKAFLSLIPLLLPLAGYALEEAISDARIRQGAMLICVGLLALFAWDAVRLDIAFVNRYLDYTEKVVAMAQTLPDRNGDGEIRLMSTDPFMLDFYGIRSVMTPRDDRDAVLEVAQRYGIDYGLTPTERPALDEVMVEGRVDDPRFVIVEQVPGENKYFYEFEFDAP
jgi:hypothetical protein